MSVGWQVTVLAAFAGVLLAAAVWILLNHRITPEKRERQRRLILSRRGRLSDGIITDASAEAIFYSYSISGVVYTASQDIGTLYNYLPSDPERLIGPVWLKYSPQNPANSIVLCERWSGLRTNAHQGETSNA